MKKSINNNYNKLNNYEKAFLNYLLKNGYSTKFIREFWNITLMEKDRKDLKDFYNFVKLRLQGLSSNKISTKIKRPRNVITQWFVKSRLPPIVSLLYQRFFLEKPGKNYKWVSIKAGKSTRLNGPWIKVPIKIKSFKDLKDVILQIEPLKEFYKRIKKFGITLVDNDLRMLLFAYLVGIIVGDSGKIRGNGKRWNSVRLTLVLSKKYHTNKRIGEFVCCCLNSIGIPAEEKTNFKNKENFFWFSRSSPLLDWVLKVCLGLKDSIATTYSPIKMKWIFSSPPEFRKWFIQGLADSDGFVGLSNKNFGIITDPNTKLIKRIIESLGIKVKDGYFGNLESVFINLHDAYKLPLFNPFVKSYRYLRIEKMEKSKHSCAHWPKWLEKEVINLIKSNFNNTQIIERILNKYRIYITSHSIRKRRKVLNHDMFRN